MVSTVKTRPNYYEILGLTPAAAGEAIAQAFARATSVVRPHAFGGLAEICLAYQTLRDPERRRAYDASLGLIPEPAPPQSVRPVSARFAKRPPIAAAPTPSTVTAPRPDPVAVPNRGAVPRPAPRPDEVDARPGPVPSIGGDWSPPADIDDPAIGIKPIEWRRTGTVVGGLVVAAVLTGAFAGWWSGRDAAKPGQAAVAAPLPAEEKLPTFSELWPEPSARAVETRAARTKAVPPRRPASVRARVERKPSSTQLAATQLEPPPIQPQPAEGVSAPSDTPALEAAPAPAMAASMPLPHRTVARTIDRIGYSCGKVASATPIEGSAGVYRVTCSSGQSFRAAPVNGRYRFRRIGSN